MKHVCVCGHTYDEHQYQGSQPCTVADCGCIAYESDPDLQADLDKYDSSRRHDG